MLIQTEASIIGNAISIKGKNRIGCPDLSANPATIKLALAPTKLPFPPRHAPRASDHQIGINSSTPPKLAAMFLINGIIVATKGMLSTIADATAETNNIESAVTVLSPSVSSITLFANDSSNPVVSTP